MRRPCPFLPFPHISRMQALSVTRSARSSFLKFGFQGFSVLVKSSTGLPPSLPSWARISSSLVGRTRPATQEGHGGTSRTEWTEYGCGSGCRRETNCMEALTRGRGRRRRGRPAIPFSDRLQSTRATPPRLSLRPKKFPLFVCKVARGAAPYERK